MYNQCGEPKGLGQDTAMGYQASFVWHQGEYSDGTRSNSNMPACLYVCVCACACFMFVDMCVFCVYLLNESVHVLAQVWSQCCTWRVLACGENTLGC